MKINRHILDNGLRLVHSQDESTQMVALNILYNVGARDEDPEHTANSLFWSLEQELNRRRKAAYRLLLYAQ
jgi:predicted Zn-dependent peptidase